MMLKAALCSEIGLGRIFQAACRTFASLTMFTARAWLVLCLLWLSGLASAYAQASKSTQASSDRIIQGHRPVQPRKNSHQQSVLSKTRSIVRPANHQELIIPHALSQENDSDITLGSSEPIHQPLPNGDDAVCDDPACYGAVCHDNIFDFISDRRAVVGSHYLLDWSRADLWIGTSGFTNPASAFVNGQNTVAQVEGSFGFQEGFNFGSQLPSLLSGQIGSQLGMRFIQSNLDGSGASDGSRSQVFATAGLFRRIDYGVQGGVVVDYLRDQWIYTADLWQLRGELSYLFSPAHEVGFRFTDGGRTHRQSVRLSTGTTLNIALQALDTYRIFGRLRFGHCAANAAEVHLGTSDDGGLLMGGVLQNPLSGQVGLETAATYFLPKASITNADTREAWNLSLALVWTPGRLFGTQRDYNRPLFEAAGNGSFIAARP